jgi:uncharacterized protein
MTAKLLDIAVESWNVMGEMSPYLLFGFLMAGILSVCISPEFIERHLGGRGFGPVLKAGLLGVPLPLCSCGVIPVAASFRRHGASRAATTSFLLSTPQTGVDSIAVTYALLGGAFAVYRPLVALVTGLLGGLLVMLFAQSNRNGNTAEDQRPECHESCCSDEGQKTNVVWRVLQYGFVTLPRDIGVPLLIGVVIAGAISALTSPDQWKPYLGGGIFSIILMMALGIPIYVCASASVPIAAGLIHLGASPGAALAFLIAGPASNAATIATIWKLLGRRTVLLYLLTIVVTAVGAGLLLDWLMPAMQLTVPELTKPCHDAANHWTATIWSVLLLAVLVFSYAAEWRRKHTDRVSGEQASHGEESSQEACLSPSSGQRTELAIEGMTCEHCVATVTRALRQCRGVILVEVDLAAGRAVVSGGHLQPNELLAAVESAGFRASIVAECSIG